MHDRYMQIERVSADAPRRGISRMCMLPIYRRASRRASAVTGLQGSTPVTFSIISYATRRAALESCCLSKCDSADSASILLICMSPSSTLPIHPLYTYVPTFGRASRTNLLTQQANWTWLLVDADRIYIIFSSLMEELSNNVNLLYRNPILINLMLKDSNYVGIL